MAEPITIGGQTFIKTEDGWIDKKSKLRAPEGLTSLLEKMQSENSPEEKKSRVRVDTSRPVVKLGKSEYVWDLNGKTWIDRKTKSPVDSKFSKLIEATYQSIDKGVTADDMLYEKKAPQPTQQESKTAAKKAVAESIFSQTGAVGQAAKQRSKKPSGGGQLPAGNIKINSPIVSMIEKLASIDNYLKQRLNNQNISAAKAISAAREQQIEQPLGDAAPVPDAENIDAEVENENKKSNAAMIVAAVGVAGLLASQLDPVKETFHAVVDFSKSVFDFVKGIAVTINAGLRNIVGTPESRAQQEQDSTVSPEQRRADAQLYSREAAEQPAQGQDNTSYGAPAGNATRRGNVSSGVATPEEITTPFPGPTSSSDTQTNSSSGTSTLGRTLIGAAVGGAVGGPVGAIIGGAVGFLSSPSDDQSATPEPSPSSAPPSAPSAGTQQAPAGQATNAPAQAAPQGANTQSTGQQPADASQISGTDYSGLTIKGGAGGQATAGGPAAENTVKFAKIVQPGLGSMFGRFTAFNDRYHQGITEYTSPHTRGIAFDLTLRDASQSTAAANKIKELADRYQFKTSILNEYTNPTKRSTGGHIHVTVHGPGVGSSVTGGSGSGEPGGDGGIVGKAATALWNLSAGAVEALGGIISAGLGPMAARNITDSLVSNAPSVSADIASASVQRVGAIAQSRTAASLPEVKIPDPPNLNSGKDTTVVQNIATASDFAGVEHYLTRMGFPKIEYIKQTPQTRVA